MSSLVMLAAALFKTLRGKQTDRQTDERKTDRQTDKRHWKPYHCKYCRSGQL